MSTKARPHGLAPGRQRRQDASAPQADDSDHARLVQRTALAEVIDAMPCHAMPRDARGPIIGFGAALARAAAFALDYHRMIGL